MSTAIAQGIVWMMGLYLALGVLFAVPFLTAGVQRIDPGAAGGSVGFRLLLLPGVAVFWPLLAMRWWKGHTGPPDEKTAHRRASTHDP